MFLSVDTYFEKSMCLHWCVALFECVLFNKAVAEKTHFHHFLARTHFSSGFIYCHMFSTNEAPVLRVISHVYFEYRDKIRPY